MLSGCRGSFLKMEFDRAEKAKADQHISTALTHYDRVIRRSPKSELGVLAGRRAANLAMYETKEYPKAIKYLRHLVLNSPNNEDQIKAQKDLAELFFAKLSDYQNAIIEYNKLLHIKSLEASHLDFRFNIAKSYFYLNKFFQARVEVESLLKKDMAEDKRFSMELLLATILFTNKKIDEAIVIYEKLLNQNPERARTENIPMSLVVCYEEQNQFVKGIELLDSLKPFYRDQGILDFKIKRLQERQANMPGSTGLRK